METFKTDCLHRLARLDLDVYSEKRVIHWDDGWTTEVRMWDDDINTVEVFVKVREWRCFMYPAAQSGNAFPEFKKSGWSFHCY
jgi:hypothetical protein